MTPHRLTDDDLALLREAAEAGFHATPPTVLGLLDLLEEYRDRYRTQVEALLHEEGTIDLRDRFDVGPWWKAGGVLYRLDGTGDVVDDEFEDSWVRFVEGRGPRPEADR